MNPRLSRAFFLLVWIALLTPLSAKKPDMLERKTPVPADQPVPVSDFFRPWLFDDPELNPSGTHFGAIVSTREDRRDLVTFNLQTKKTERLSGGVDFDIYSYEWLNDKRIVFSLVEEKRFSAGLFAVELGDFDRSYALQRYNVIIPVGRPRKAPSEIIIWIRNSTIDGEDGGVLRINTNRGIQRKDDMVLLEDDGMRADIIKAYDSPKGGIVRGYMADREGELAFAFTIKDGRGTLHRLVNDSKWEKCPVDLDEYSVLGVGDIPGELLVLESRVEGKPRGLFRMNAVTGEIGALLVRDEQYDVVSPRLYRHPRDNRVLGLQYARRGPQSVWFEENYRVIQSVMEKALPGRVVRIIGSDLDEKQFFVSASSDVQPVSYFHVKIAAKSVELVTNVAPWIDSARMQPMQTMKYKSRDGFEIEGYVTLPKGASKEKKAPLVVLPHGGPWVRDNWGWDPEAQFLASRGYAVFQPNYRGSAGYGWRFPENDMWAFRKMHDDVTDGVKALLKTGVIDADRMAIMGGSFGAYLALSGAAHEPDLYRCAITIAGVFDWERMLQDARSSEYGRGRYGVYKRNLGDPARRREEFEKISPLKHVNKVKVPVFVAHGTADQVAAVAQSELLIAELKKNGVVFEKQIERGEGHGFQKLENQVELYTAIEAFLAKNMAPRNTPTSVAKN